MISSCCFQKRSFTNMCSSRRRNKLSSNSSRVILLKGGWVFVFLPKAPGESKERLFLYVMFLIHHISGCILSRGLESILSHVFKRKFMKYMKCALVHHLIILRHSFFFLNFIFIYFLFVSQGMWDLSSWPGIEPVLPAMEVRILNHLTARESPFYITLVYGKSLHFIPACDSTSCLESIFSF